MDRTETAASVHDARDFAEELGIRLKPRVDWDKYRHLLGTMSDPELSRQTGIHAGTIVSARKRFGIPPYNPTPKPGVYECGNMTMYRKGCRCKKCKRANADYSVRYKKRPNTRGNYIRWEEHRHLLGTMSDLDVAKKLNSDRRTVWSARTRLKIPAFKTYAPRADWSKVEHLLGKEKDDYVASVLGVSRAAVSSRRELLGIPAQRTREHITKQEAIQAVVHLLGKVPDIVLARMAGVNRKSIQATREDRGIPRWRAKAE